MSKKKDKSIKEKSDQLRVDILNCSDEDLVYFSHAIFAETFESIPQRISKVAKEHVKGLPF